MATFITDAILRTHVTAANAMRAEPLPDHWDAIVPRANIRAYNRLQAILLGRGFTAAEFASWGSGSTSHGYDWNIRLGVLFAFVEASKSDEDRGRAYLDELKALLEELMTETVVIDGAAVYPTGAGGRIGQGDLDTSEDRFLLDTPDGSGSFGTDGGTRF
jgi:hypothetical protein